MFEKTERSKKIEEFLQSKPGQYLSLIIIAILAYGFFFSGGEESSVAKVEKEGGDTTTAQICAQNYMERQLRSPSTADFPLFADSTHIKEDMYVVSSYVDSENGFGAEIRTNFVCDVEIIDKASFNCDVTCVY